MAIVFEGEITEPEMADYLRVLDETTDRAYRTGQRVGFVMDARRGMAAPANVRRLMADWMKAHDEDSRATCAGFAFVIPNGLMRGTLTAILWLAPMPAPHTVVAEVGEALSWTRQQVGEAVPVDGISRRTGT